MCMSIPGTRPVTQVALPSLKSPVGRIFYDYFGENLLRSDLSISVGELGSLLDHSGPIGESEKYAARVFGAQTIVHSDQWDLHLQSGDHDVLRRPAEIMPCVIAMPINRSSRL